MPTRLCVDQGRGRGTYHYARHPRGMMFDQDYERMREQCLSEGILFEDPYFPADDSSLFYKNRPEEEITWRRPHEICRSTPVWLSDRPSRFDVVQGYIGDCWLLAAAASLTVTSNKRLLERVVPPDQSFQHGYCGMFRFRLWYQGRWENVVVDDRLPTFDPEYPQLLYMHSKNRTEFWSALLEKAYAKLYGCYECLEGGNAVESLEDLTGGLGETFIFAERSGMFCTSDNKHECLRNLIEKTLERGGLLTCSMNTKTAYSHVDVRKSVEGLLYNHAYSVTAAQQVDLTDGTSEFLVRVRNPWGDGREWRGEWSDESVKWGLVPRELKRQMSLTIAADGEFWISLADFTEYFTKMDLCNLDPLYIEENAIDSHMKWDVVSYHKSWIQYVNAGGCLNYRDSMWKNPQFRVTLTNPDDLDGDLCTMIVALMQKDRRRLFKEGQEFLNIGYVIYELNPRYNRPLDEDFFRHYSPVGKSGQFMNTREVCRRHQLPPGDYVIIPSTFQPEQAAHFLLRIFTEKHKTSREIDEETSFWRDTVDSLDVVDGQNDELDHLIATFGEKGDIDAYELMDILKTHLTTGFPFPGFPLDTCRSMVAMNDNLMTGRLSSEGYKTLCRDLIEWKAAFEKTDSEKNGRFSSYSLRPTLLSLGYHLSNGTLQAMVLRYVNRDGDIEFPDFILSVVKLKTLLATFEKSDLNDIEDFVQATLYT